jgi:hypothetical protein
MSHSTNDNQSRTNPTNAPIDSSMDQERSCKKDVLQNPQADPNDMADIFGDVIFSYTRAQAIEDGVLIDVSEIAREASFVIPVAMTAGVFSQCVEWTAEDIEAKGDTENNRLWDVVFMANHKIRMSPDKGHLLNFIVAVVPRVGDSSAPVEIKLKMVVSGDDQGEPVITIMLLSED